MLGVATGGATKRETCDPIGVPAQFVQARNFGAYGDWLAEYPHLPHLLHHCAPWGLPADLSASRSHPFFARGKPERTGPRFDVTAL